MYGQQLNKVNNIFRSIIRESSMASIPKLHFVHEQIHEDLRIFHKKKKWLMNDVRM